MADAKSGGALVEVVEQGRAAKLEIRGHEELKTAPRGYPKDHPRIDLLRQKGLIAWREWPVGPWLDSKRPKTRVIDFLHAAEPLRAWLSRHVERKIAGT